MTRPTGKTVGWWLSILLTVGAGLGVVLHVVATPWQPLIVLAALAHFVMWAAPLGLLVAIGLRRWRTAVAAGVVSAAVLAVQLPPTVAEGAKVGHRLVVLQANLKIGAADPTALVRIVRENRVDVLATEELTTSEEQRLVAAGLTGVLPYRFTKPLPGGGGGLGLWSRYPLSGGRDLPGFWLGVLTARIALPGRTATAVAVHLTPPYPYPVGRWRREIVHLGQVLPRTGAVIVAGDFNATTDHRQFRDLLAHGYDDAAEESGAGYLPSYPNDRWYGPVIGIDHVLLRGGVAATEARTLELARSDHRALIVRGRY